MVLPFWVSAAVAFVVPVKVKLPVGETETVISCHRVRVGGLTFSVTVLEVALLNVVESAVW